MSFKIRDVYIEDAVNTTINTLYNRSQTYTTIRGSGTVNINIPFTHLIITENPNVIILPEPSCDNQQQTLFVENIISPANNNSLTIVFINTKGLSQTINYAKIGDVFIFIGFKNSGWAFTDTTQSIAPQVSTLKVAVIHADTALVKMQGNVISSGSGILTEIGASFGNKPIYTTTLEPYPGTATTGIFEMEFNANVGPPGDAYIRAYATAQMPYWTGDETNIATVTGYGDPFYVKDLQCLIEGTMIILSNGEQKLIENIDYSDELMVWNFDEGKIDKAYPLWIKIPEKTTQYNLLKFNDGSELCTVGQHRIFNIEKGKFTYPMTDDTPIGTTTINFKGEKIILISKEIINKDVNYYNIITKYHMNMYASTILTSCRYNNLYPVDSTSMKFIKNQSELVDEEKLHNISQQYIDGLRLCENKIDIEETKKYISRLERTKLY